MIIIQSTKQKAILLSVLLFLVYSRERASVPVLFGVFSLRVRWQTHLSSVCCQKHCSTPGIHSHSVIKSHRSQRTAIKALPAGTVGLTPQAICSSVHKRAPPSTASTAACKDCRADSRSQSCSSQIYEHFLSENTEASIYR